MNWISFWDSPPILQGRSIANEWFFRALGRYSKKLGRRSLLIPYPGSVADWMKRGRFEILPRESLPGLPFGDAVVYQPDLDWAGVLRLRDRLALRFPVCAFTHSLSYPHLIRSFVSALPYVQRGDVVVCSSDSAFRVMSAVLERVGIRGPELVKIPLGPPWLSNAHIGEYKRRRQALRRELGLANKTVFLSFGRISEFSKADLMGLFKVVYRIYRRRRDFLVLIAGATGESDYHRFLQDLAKAWGVSDVVRIVPDPAEGDKYALFAVSDAFLGLSDNFQETFGIAVLEALAWGLFVIVSDWGGFRDVVAGHEGVRLIPTFTVEGIEDEMAVYESISYEPKLHLFWASTIALDLAELEQAMEDCLEGRCRYGIQREIPSWNEIVGAWEGLWEEQLRRYRPEMSVDRDCVEWKGSLGEIFYRIYPSRRIDARVKYRLRVRDLDLLPKGLGLHPWLRDVMDGDKIKRVLACGFEGSISELVERFGLTKGEMMWALKQGWLGLISN